MSKPLDKMTKAELIALVLYQQDRAIRAETALSAAEGKIADLSDQITSLERRRLNEGNGYRKLIAKKSGRHVPPSQDDSISDEDLTPAQRVIREHRRAQTA